MLRRKAILAELHVRRLLQNWRLFELLGSLRWALETYLQGSRTSKKL